MPHPTPNQQLEGYTHGREYPEFNALMVYLVDQLGMRPKEAEMYATQILNYPEASGRKQVIDTAVEQDRADTEKHVAMMRDQKLSQMQQYGQLMMATPGPSRGLPAGKRVPTVRSQ